MTLSFVLFTDVNARSYTDVHQTFNNKDTEDLIQGKTGMSKATTVLSQLTRVKYFKLFKNRQILILLGL